MGARSAHGRIEINLLERRSSERQAEEKLLHLGTIFRHLVEQHIVHMSLNPLGLLFLFVCYFPDNLCSYGATGGEHLHDRLRLEPDNSLRENGVMNAASPGPWRCPVLNLQSEKIKPLHISVLPF